MIDKAKQVVAAAKDKMTDAVTHLDESLQNYRAGKANPAVFNPVMVSYYGTMTPLPQTASITAPDAKTILISRGTKPSSRLSRRPLWMPTWASLPRTTAK